MAEPAAVRIAQSFQAQLRAADEEVILSMTRRWGNIEAQLQAEIDALAQQLADARDRGETVPKWKLYKMERYQSLLAQIGREVSSYMQWAIVQLQDQAAKAQQLAKRQAAEQIKVQAGLDPTEQIRALWDRLATEPVEKLQALARGGGPLHDILSSAYPAAVKGLTDKLLYGTAVGWHPRKTAREMLRNGGLDQGLNHVLLVARDQQIRNYREAARDAYKASPLIYGYMRIAAKNERTCLACLALDGRVYPTAERMELHPQDRCSMIPLIHGRPIPQYLTGLDWLKAQPEDRQRRMMGPGRFDLWKRGGFRLDQLVTVKQNKIWGPNAQETSLRALKNGGGGHPFDPPDIDALAVSHLAGGGGVAAPKAIDITTRPTIGPVAGGIDKSKLSGSAQSGAKQALSKAQKGEEGLAYADGQGNVTGAISWAQDQDDPGSLRITAAGFVDAAENLKGVQDVAKAAQAEQKGIVTRVPEDLVGRYQGWGFRVEEATTTGFIVKLPAVDVDKFLDDPEALGFEQVLKVSGQTMESLEDPESITSFTNGYALEDTPYHPAFLPDSLDHLQANTALDGQSLQVPKGKHPAAGMILYDPASGKFVLTQPAKGYGGYTLTLPKGTVDEGEGLQEAAIREVYEETGFIPQIVGSLGDFEKSTSSNRFYIGVVTDGAPWDAGDESKAVHLAGAGQLLDALGTESDKKIVQEFLEVKAEADKLGQGDFVAGIQAVEQDKINKQEAIQQSYNDAMSKWLDAGTDTDLEEMRLALKSDLALVDPDMVTLLQEDIAAKVQARRDAALAAKAENDKAFNIVQGFWQEGPDTLANVHINDLRATITWGYENGVFPDVLSDLEAILASRQEAQLQKEPVAIPEEILEGNKGPLVDYLVRETGVTHWKINQLKKAQIQELDGATKAEILEAGEQGAAKYYAGKQAAAAQRPERRRPREELIHIPREVLSGNKAPLVNWIVQETGVTKWKINQLLKEEIQALSGQPPAAFEAAADAGAEKYYAAKQEKEPEPVESPAEKAERAQEQDAIPQKQMNETGDDYKKAVASFMGIPARDLKDVGPGELSSLLKGKSKAEAQPLLEEVILDAKAGAAYGEWLHASTGKGADVLAHNADRATLEHIVNTASNGALINDASSALDQLEGQAKTRQEQKQQSANKWDELQAHVAAQETSLSKADLSAWTVDDLKAAKEAAPEVFGQLLDKVISEKVGDAQLKWEDVTDEDLGKIMAADEPEPLTAAQSKQIQLGKQIDAASKDAMNTADFFQKLSLEQLDAYMAHTSSDPTVTAHSLAVQAQAQKKIAAEDALWKAMGDLEGDPKAILNDPDLPPHQAMGKELWEAYLVKEIPTAAQELMDVHGVEALISMQLYLGTGLDPHEKASAVADNIGSFLDQFVDEGLISQADIDQATKTILDLDTLGETDPAKFSEEDAFNKFQDIFYSAGSLDEGADLLAQTMSVGELQRALGLASSQVDKNGINKALALKQPEDEPPPPPGSPSKQAKMADAGVKLYHQYQASGKSYKTFLQGKSVEELEQLLAFEEENFPGAVSEVLTSQLAAAKKENQPLPPGVAQTIKDLGVDEYDDQFIDASVDKMDDLADLYSTYEDVPADALVDNMTLEELAAGAKFAFIYNYPEAFKSTVLEALDISLIAAGWDGVTDSKPEPEVPDNLMGFMADKQGLDGQRTLAKLSAATKGAEDKVDALVQYASYPELSKALEHAYAISASPDTVTNLVKAITAKGEGMYRAWDKDATLTTMELDFALSWAKGHQDQIKAGDLISLEEDLSLSAEGAAAVEGWHYADKNQETLAHYAANKVYVNKNGGLGTPPWKIHPQAMVELAQANPHMFSKSEMDQLQAFAESNGRPDDLKPTSGIPLPPGKTQKGIKYMTNADLISHITANSAWKRSELSGFKKAELTALMAPKGEEELDLSDLSLEDLAPPTGTVDVTGADAELVDIIKQKAAQSLDVPQKFSDKAADKIAAGDQGFMYTDEDGKLLGVMALGSGPTAFQLKITGIAMGNMETNVQALGDALQVAMEQDKKLYTWVPQHLQEQYKAWGFENESSQYYELDPANAPAQLLNAATPAGQVAKQTTKGPLPLPPGVNTAEQLKDTTKAQMVAHVSNFTGISQSDLQALDQPDLIKLVGSTNAVEVASNAIEEKKALAQIKDAFDTVQAKGVTGLKTSKQAYDALEYATSQVELPAADVDRIRTRALELEEEERANVPFAGRQRARPEPRLPRERDLPEHEDFPGDPGQLKRISSLGGTTGAELVEDPATGKRYVRKYGNSAGHVETEIEVDAMYQEMGFNVPRHQRYVDESGKPFKLAEFVEGTPAAQYLRSASPSQRRKVEAQIQEAFALDALVGNWDVAGHDFDNILVDNDGNVWRIDNGGSLQYRAQGEIKTDRDPNDWNGWVTDLWSMRERATGAARHSAPIYQKMDWYEITEQMEAIVAKGPELLAKVDPSQRATVHARLEHMRDIAETSRAMRNDNMDQRFPDRLHRHGSELKQRGFLDRLPKRLEQRGSTGVVDENGRHFDKLRGTDSLVGFVKRYMDEEGLDQRMIGDYMGEQARNSWRPMPLAVKYHQWLMRGKPEEGVFWNGSFDEAKREYQRMAQRAGGEEKLHDTITAWRAFIYESLRNTDFKFNNHEQGYVQVVRTTSSTPLQGLRPDYGKWVRANRGLMESCSLFKTVSIYAGTNTTLMRVPYHRIMAYYFHERYPGAGGGSLAGEGENEFVVDLANLDFIYASRDVVQADRAWEQAARALGEPDLDPKRSTP